MKKVYQKHREGDTKKRKDEKSCGKKVPTAICGKVYYVFKVFLFCFVFVLKSRKKLNLYSLCLVVFLVTVATAVSVVLAFGFFPKKIIN